MNTKLKGKTGEDIACSYLKQNGYKIMDRNYKTDIGEIDIVCTDTKTLIFVEVKARSTEDFGYPSEAVTYHKRQKINQVSSQYIKQFRLFDVAVRFDVIEVYMAQREVNHIINAFDSYLRY